MMNKSNYTAIKEVIDIPSPTLWLEQFRDITAKNVKDIFQFDEKDTNRSYWLQQFLENSDHGAEHVYNVYKKADEIAHQIEVETWEKIDHDLLYIMIALHDSGRFYMEPPVEWDSFSEKQRKEKKAEKTDRRHELYGVFQFRFALAKMKKRWIEIDPAIVDKVIDYVYNHDFMSEKLSWKWRFHEPLSLEWKIARLADRISTPAIPELERYRETGKRRWTTFYNPDITFAEREVFSFAKIWQYAKEWKLDQFMFFSTLLAIKSSDFWHPVLQEIYSKWAPQKREAAERIISLAREEHIDEIIIDQMKHTLQQYAKVYEFDF